MPIIIHRGHPCTERSDQTTLKQKCGCELCRARPLAFAAAGSASHPCSPWPVHTGNVSIAEAFNTLLLCAFIESLASQRCNS